MISSSGGLRWSPRLLRDLARHPVARNIGALYGIQIATYILPLITVPFLARVLRADAFGELAFAQSFAGCSSLLVEFGFVYSATRELARNQSNPTTIAEVVAAVLGAKALLLTCLAAVAVMACFWVAAFQHHHDYLAGACCLAAALGLSPMWYYQGIEDMGRATLVDLCGRGAATLAIFTWIRRPSDGPTVLFLLAGGAGLAGSVNYLHLYRQVTFKVPRWAQALEALRRGFGLFFFRASVSLYTTANIFVLGLFVPAAQLADYAGAEKILRAVLGLLAPVSQALFPRMSHLMAHYPEQGRSWGRLALILLSAFGCLLAGALVLAAPWLVLVLLGSGYHNAVPLLRVLAAIIPLVAVSTVLGVQWMLPLRLDRKFTAIIAMAGIVNLGLAIAWVPRISDLGMALATVSSEALVATSMALVLWTYTRNGSGAAAVRAPY